MVVSTLELSDDDVDRIFRALADRTRRDIVRAAMDGSQSVSALARRYPMSVTAVQKHVSVLERAGLVERTRQGREQLVQTRMATVTRARELLDELERVWRDRIDRIGDLLADDTDSHDTDGDDTGATT